MDHNDIVWRLAQLASLPYQERYIVQGTSDEFLTARDILEDVDAVRIAMNRGHVVDGDLSSIDLFAELFHAMDGAIEIASSIKSENRPNDSVIFSKQWDLIRNRAAYLLEHYGINIHDMSVSDIDQLAE